MQKKTMLKIWIFFCVMSFFMSSLTFADGTNSNTEWLSIINTFISVIILFCSRARILFAKLAGYFLSNAVIFWESRGIDGLLWNLWNMMKNIANFGLGFLLLREIGKSLFWKAEVFSKDMIKKLLIAWLWIQMSWFLCATIIDLSTVSLAGISWITTQVLDSGNKNVIEDTFKRSKYYDTLFEWKNEDRQFLTNIVKIGKEWDWLPKITVQKAKTFNTGTDLEMVLDGFLPDRNDFSGPLMFIGISLFDILDFNTSLFKQEENTKELFKDLIHLVFDGTVTIVFYTFTMIMLTLIGLLRVFILQGFIILSPLIILLSQFSVWWHDKVEFWESNKYSFTIEAFISLVFWPVFVCWGLLLAEIVFWTLKEAVPSIGSMNLWELNCMATVHDVDYTSTCSAWEIFSFLIDGLKTPFMQVIINLLWIWLMWIILKRSITTLKFEPLKKVAEAWVSLAERFVTTTPFIPVGQRKLSLSNAQEIRKTATSSHSWFMHHQQTQWSQDVENTMNDIFWLPRTNSARLSAYLQTFIDTPPENPDKLHEIFKDKKFQEFKDTTTFADIEGLLTAFFKNYPKTQPIGEKWQSKLTDTEVQKILKGLWANIPNWWTEWNENLKKQKIKIP